MRNSDTAKPISSNHDLLANPDKSISPREFLNNPHNISKRIQNKPVKSKLPKFEIVNPKISPLNKPKIVEMNSSKRLQKRVKMHKIRAKSGGKLEKTYYVKVPMPAK